IGRPVADRAPNVDQRVPTGAPEANRDDVGAEGIGDELGRLLEDLLEILGRGDDTRHPAQQPGSGVSAFGRDRSAHHLDLLPAVRRYRYTPPASDAGEWCHTGYHVSLS